MLKYNMGKNEIIKQRGLRTHCINNRHCDDCGKKVRKFRHHKGKFLCYNCWRANVGDIIWCGDSQNGFTLEQALNKVHEVKYRKTNQGFKTKPIAPPQVLIGRKVRFQLVEEKPREDLTEIEELKERLQKSDSMTSEEINKLWNHYTNETK